jgi:hypothetical protein
LLEFAGQVASDDLLPTRLPDKINKPKWAKPKKTHDKASKRLMTGAETAEQAADKAERAATRPVTPQQDESDGGGVIVVAIRTPERLRGPPNLVLPPASTAPARIEDGARKRRRIANKRYTDSQYEL